MLCHTCDMQDKFKSREYCEMIAGEELKPTKAEAARLGCKHDYVVMFQVDGNAYAAFVGDDYVGFIIRE